MCKILVGTVLSNGDMSARGIRYLHRGTERKAPWIGPMRWQTREAIHRMISKGGGGRLADDLRHKGAPR